MSVFSTWSHLARASLKTAGIPIPLGQVHQVLSAGLGHASFASFSLQEVDAMETAKYAVLDTDRMQQRASEFQLQLSSAHCIDVVQAIRQKCRMNGPYPVALNTFGNLISPLVLDSAHPIKDEIARRLNGQPNNSLVFSFNAVTSIDASVGQWTWNVTGLVYVASDADYQVPFNAEVVYPKLGKQLLGPGHISQFAQSGDPELLEPDFTTEFDPHGMHD
ncbi:hypothetical protein [Rhodoferax saidenbachensis]|uniref:Uncharacterized protein n=1 Tax=Rhodoferax saidenbachensis TaxID=1484693 RepID=A0ABU1ZTQ7_9BURK|nr:hypothetical protein [Rhodoferax saidenbachensis]MDR7307921.1 hypothetical protein [Rhodoferax saidenbachensis]